MKPRWISVAVGAAVAVAALSAFAGDQDRLPRPVAFATSVVSPKPKLSPKRESFAKCLLPVLVNTGSCP